MAAVSVILCKKVYSLIYPPSSSQSSSSTSLSSSPSASPFQSGGVDVALRDRSVPRKSLSSPLSVISVPSSSNFESGLILSSLLPTLVRENTRANIFHTQALTIVDTLRQSLYSFAFRDLSAIEWGNQCGETTLLSIKPSLNESGKDIAPLPPVSRLYYSLSNTRNTSLLGKIYCLSAISELFHNVIPIMKQSNYKSMKQQIDAYRYEYNNSQTIVGSEEWELNRSRCGPVKYRVIYIGSGDMFSHRILPTNWKLFFEMAKYRLTNS